MLNNKVKRIFLYVSVLLIALSMLIYFNINISYNDEAFSFGLISHKIPNIIKIDSLDVHPPLYYILLRIFLIALTCWTKSIFIKILFARLFSLMSLILFIYFANKILCQCSINVRYKYLIFIMFMLVPSVLEFGTRIRMYELASLFLIIELYNLIQFSKRYTTLNFVFIIIFSILASYTLYIAAISAGLYLLFYAVIYLYQKRYKDSFKMIISGFLLILCYIPWIIFVYKHMQSHLQNDNGGVVSIRFYIKNILLSLSQMNITNKFGNALACLFILSSLGLILYFIKRKFYTNLFVKLFYINLFNVIFTTSLSFILCKNKFQFLVIYPIFSIFILFIICIICNALDVHCKLIYKIFGIMIIGISLIFFIQNDFNVLQTHVTSSIGLIKKFDIQSNTSNKYVYVNMNKYPITNIRHNINTNIYNKYAQDSIYLSSINKKEILSNTSYRYLSRYIVNNDNDSILIRSVFKNLIVSNNK